MRKVNIDISFRCKMGLGGLEDHLVTMARKGLLVSLGPSDRFYNSYAKVKC